MVEIQKHKDYPCKDCGILSWHISTLCPGGFWVCTNPACHQAKIGDDDMKRWQKQKEKMERQKAPIRIGMKFFRGRRR